MSLLAVLIYHVQYNTEIIPKIAERFAPSKMRRDRRPAQHVLINNQPPKLGRGVKWLRIPLTI